MVYRLVLISIFCFLSDPEPIYHTVVSSQNDASIRIQNINCILKNIKMLYEVSNINILCKIFF